MEGIVKTLAIATYIIDTAKRDKRYELVNFEKLDIPDYERVANIFFKNNGLEILLEINEYCSKDTEAICGYTLERINHTFEKFILEKGYVYNKSKDQFVSDKDYIDISKLEYLGNYILKEIKDCDILKGVNVHELDKNYSIYAAENLCKFPKELLLFISYLHGTIESYPIYTYTILVDCFRYADYCVYSDYECGESRLTDDEKDEEDFNNAHFASSLNIKNSVEDFWG